VAVRMTEARPLSKRVRAEIAIADYGEDEQSGPVADAGGGSEVGPERQLTHSPLYVRHEV